MPPLRTNRSGAVVLGVVVALASACSAPSTSPVASPAGSEFTQADADCPTINLRDPSGAEVDLSGEWRPDPEWDWMNTWPDNPEQAFIRQSGQCVWMTIVDTAFREDSMPGQSYLGQFEGRLHQDFSLTGTLVTLLSWSGSSGGYRQLAHSFPVRLEVRWDCDGHICLHEIRQGEGRCLIQQATNSTYCPPEAVLHREEDVEAAASPSP